MPFELAALILAALVVALPQASASPPGTMDAVAAGEDHLWWAVRRKRPEVPGANRAGVAPEFLLMHHASEEPAPTERFVMSLGAEPEAMAAEGTSLVLVMPPAGERGRMTLFLGAARNEAIGHWYTEPRGGPRVLRPLDTRGTIVDAEMAGGQLHLLRTGGAEAPGPTFELLSLDVAGAGADWTPVPLPAQVLRSAVDGSATGAGPFEDLSDAKLFRDQGAIGLARLANGTLHLARRTADGWTEEAILLADSTESASALAEAGDSGTSLVGLTRFGGALILAVRSPAPGAEASIASTGIRLLTLRQGLASSWASFAEPTRSYSLAAFGPGVAVLELDDEGRGVVRSIAPSRDAPGDPIVLMPPGFASARWVHLPILAAISVAFVLAALLFGSDSYMQSRSGGKASDGPRAPPGVPPGAPPPPMRAVGAALSRRFLAFVFDCAPGLAIGWTVIGGSPLQLIDHPMLRADIMAALPTAMVLASGWALGVVGDTFFGRSPGKRLIGLKIIARDGGPAGMGRRFARGLLSLPAVCSPAVMLVAVVHPWCDGPAEMLSGTAVVDESAPLQRG